MNHRADSFLLLTWSQNLRRWLLLPLVIGTCLAGCGGPREQAVALIADLGSAEACIQRNATSLIHLREGKPGTDYEAIAKALAQEYDTIKRSVAKAERNAEVLEGIITEANRQASSATADGAPALRTALSELAHSRDRVNTLSGYYLPDIYNIVRALGQSGGTGEIGDRKIRVALTVDFGDQLIAALADLNAKLKIVSGLLVEQS